MEIKHTIKLSSGKIIELTEQEYQEIKDSFKSVEYIPAQPYYTEYPWWPYGTKITCSHDNMYLKETIENDSGLTFNYAMDIKQ